jgi:hypothetical protein
LSIKYIHIMRKFIATIAPKTVTDALITAINSALTPFSTYKISLSNDEKLGTRSMAEGREGYARLVSRIANQFPNSLSRVDVPADLSNLLDYYQNLEAVRLAYIQGIETIEETQLGAATDIMTLVDRYAQNLQISRANEGALDGAMKEVDEWNKRFVNKSTPTPPEN